MLNQHKSIMAEIQKKKKINDRLSPKKRANERRYIKMQPGAGSINLPIPSFFSSEAMQKR